MLCAAVFWGCAGTLPAADEKTGWWPPFVPDVPVPAAAEPIQSPAGGETLVIEGAGCAGISGFRADWNVWQAASTTQGEELSSLE
jgi:hypothetical protein